MTDAQKFNAIYSALKSVKITEELIVLGGVVSFLGGVFVAGSLLKTVLFLTSGVLISFVIVKLVKHAASSTYVRSVHASKNEEEQNVKVKKLVFDDFQASDEQYQIKFVDETKDKLAKLNNEERIKTNLKMPEKSVTTTFDINEFIESPNEGKSNEGGPRVEFNVLIKRVLNVVKDVHFAHTVCLFWINKEKQQLVLENYVTDSEKFMSHKRFPLSSDLVSQIAINGKPQIVNYVNALSQNEMIPYYTSTESIKTFVGVPIFYDGATVYEPMAVLLLDCLETDAYGNETIVSLAQIAKLISTLIRSYTAKYDLLLDSEALRSIDRIREHLSIDFSTHSISRSLAEEVSRLLPWDYIVVVLFDDNKKSWIVHYLMNRMNDSYVPLHSELDAQQSMVASVIQTGVPKIIDDIASITSPRFYQAERCDSKGALLIVPLNSLSRCYGALLVESKDAKTYSEPDIKLVRKLTETASWALEILSLTEIMNNYVSLDETTGVLTRKSFMARLQEEVQRANDFSNELSIVMISIDRMEEHIKRYGREAFDFILQNVGRLIKISTRHYDVLGRFDFNCFVVLLVNTTSNEASLWAEKIRKNVASNIINIDNKSFSVTISVGVAGAMEDATDVNLLENADRVLRKAIEAGGNIIRIY